MHDMPIRFKHLSTDGTTTHLGYYSSSSLQSLVLCLHPHHDVSTQQKLIQRHNYSLTTEQDKTTTHHIKDGPRWAKPSLHGLYGPSLHSYPNSQVIATHMTRITQGTESCCALLQEVACHQLRLINDRQENKLSCKPQKSCNVQMFVGSAACDGIRHMTVT